MFSCLLVVPCQAATHPLSEHGCRCLSLNSQGVEPSGGNQVDLPNPFSSLSSTASPPRLSTRHWGSHHHPSITASDGSIDTALVILSQITTPSSILFDPRYTTRQRPTAFPPHTRAFPPFPTTDRRSPPQVPSTISIQNLDIEDNTSTMDKRHPSSFQQLEKLGEGTYATVCIARSGSNIRYSSAVRCFPGQKEREIVAVMS